MKRGKEEEKTMGPLFPRLHVNDTAEKGGPRAPPRNKMALYEQLSIPSQRFGSALVNVPSSASSSQGSGVERNMGFSCSLPQSSPIFRSEKFHGLNSESLDGPLASHLEQRPKGREDNEFTVPVFVQPRKDECHLKSQQSFDRQAVSSITSACSGQNQGIKHNDASIDGGFRQQVRNPSKEKNGNVSNQIGRENVNGRAREACSGCPVSNISESCEDETCLSHWSSVGPRVGSANRGDDVIESRRDNLRSESCCGEGDENGGKHNGHFNRSSISLQLKRVDKGDSVFETPIVESVSGVDIAPDDVVGIIGQKHFWKARKAIVNQQRVFAAQVFELHKLIQVQRLIAESPHLLFDGAFLAKSSFKCLPGRTLPAEFVVKPLPVVVDAKDDSEKRTHKNECSAENAVTKISLSPLKNAIHSTNYGPHTIHPQPMVATTDNKAGPWCFPQPPGPQWLVPVMSPSEGLVYKPYPGSIYGGFGPFGPPPMSGNYTNSPNGLMGNSPAAHPYFPYGITISNPTMSGSVGEQGKPFTGPNSQSQTGPILGASLNIEQQSSSNVPSTAQKNGMISEAGKFQASKGSDLQQGSTASSPSERGNRVKEPLQVFPTGPLTSQSDVANKPTRVIKVVPHNPRSATESAARIFQFIQEERKQYNFL